MCISNGVFSSVGLLLFWVDPRVLFISIRVFQDGTSRILLLYSIRNTWRGSRDFFNILSVPSNFVYMNTFKYFTHDDTMTLIPLSLGTFQLPELGS